MREGEEGGGDVGPGGGVDEEGVAAAVLLVHEQVPLSGQRCVHDAQRFCI